MAFFYQRIGTVAIFIVCLIAIGATAYYRHGNITVSHVSFENVSAVSVATTDSTVSSSDNENWKNQFIDSSTDSTFVKPKTSATVATKEEPLTATDMLGREFMTKYMLMQQAGIANDQKSINDAANTLIQESVSNIQPPKTFILENINVVTSNDLRSLRVYAESLTGVIKTYIPNTDNNEVVIAVNALDKNDMSMLARIDPVIANYRTALKVLVSMPVPSPLSQHHLNLLNGVNIALFNAISFRELDKDPFKGMAAVSMEVSALTLMDNAMRSIENYLNLSGVPFQYSS